ncbi:MAG: hypothetical protein AAB851_02830, partial [Patescibacteria group bacterium]
MVNYKKISFIILLAAAALAFLVFGQKVSLPTNAGAGDNVFGFTWSENIGWISFNNLAGDGQPAGGGGTDYGVRIDENSGDFSGYAWSENIGWISFNRSDTGNPPSDDPGAGSGAIAKVNLSNGQISGWMRALSQGGGWDGWIRLNPPAFGGVFVNMLNGDFSGWAWGSDVVGWVSFNSA